MFSPPKLTAAEAEAANAACRLAALAGREFGVAMAPGGRVPDGDDAVKFVVAVDGLDATALIPSRFLQLVAQSFFALGNGYEVPDQLIAPAFEATIAPFLARLEKAAGLKLAIRSVAEAKVSRADLPPLVFDVSGLAERGYLAVTPPAGFTVHETALAPSLDTDSLVIRAPVVLAETEVTVAELSDLAAGDVVMLPALSPQQEPQVCLAILPRKGIIAKIERDGLVLSHLGDRFMSTNEAAAPKAAAAPGKAETAPASTVVPAATVEEIPLNLVFDFGEIEFTVAELKALVPGQVLNLAREPGSAVRLTVNGRRIGAGEIVEIDGRLGVRITELANRQ